MIGYQCNNAYGINHDFTEKFSLNDVLKGGLFTVLVTDGSEDHDYLPHAKTGETIIGEVMINHAGFFMGRMYHDYNVCEVGGILYNKNNQLYLDLVGVDHLQQVHGLSQLPLKNPGNGAMLMTYDGGLQIIFEPIF